jgi:hypothetical protein
LLYIVVNLSIFTKHKKNLIKMGSGRLIAIIGGVLGILSVVLFHLFPEIFAFWRIEGGGGGIYLGGFAFEYLVGSDPAYTEDILLLIIFILVVAGGALAIVGGLIENKLIGTLGGLLRLVGPILFIISLAIELGDFSDLAALVEFSTGERFLLFGSAAGLDWGLWVGTFLALGAGVIGLIGGLKVED